MSSRKHNFVSTCDGYVCFFHDNFFPVINFLKRFAAQREGLK